MLGAANTATSTTEIDGLQRNLEGNRGEQVTGDKRAAKEKGPGFSSKPLIDLVRDAIELGIQLTSSIELFDKSIFTVPHNVPQQGRRSFTNPTPTAAIPASCRTTGAGR